MADLDTVLSGIHDRLLKTEGELFVLKSVVHVAISVDDVAEGIMRKALIAMAESIASELPNAPDEPNKKFIVAAQAAIENLLTESASAPKPILTVIRGGKSNS